SPDVSTPTRMTLSSIRSISYMNRNTPFTNAFLQPDHKHRKRRVILPVKITARENKPLFRIQFSQEGQQRIPLFIPGIAAAVDAQTHHAGRLQKNKPRLHCRQTRFSSRSNTVISSRKI